MFIRLFLLINILIYSSFAIEKISKISLQLQWKHQFEFAGYYMAKEKGFYKEKNLNVIFREYNNFDINIIDEVLNGNSDFGLGYTNVIFEKLKNKNISLINATFQSSPHILISLKSSNIKSIKDFKNKTIMINEDATKTISMLSMLKSKNIDLKKDMNIKKHTFDINDLINGNTDIFSSFSSNELFHLEKLNIEYDVWNPKDFGFEFYDGILFSSNEFIKDNKKVVTNFKKASLKGWDYAFNNIEETVDLIYNKYNTQNKTKEALLYEANKLKELSYYKTSNLGDININNINRIIDVYKILGYFNNDVNLKDFIFKEEKHFFTNEEKNYINQKKKLNICIDPDNLPFEGIQDGIYIGFISNYMKLFSKKLNVPFQLFRTKNYKDSIKNLKNKKCEILSSVHKIYKNEKNFKKDNLVETIPYFKENLVISTTLDKNYIKNIEDLNGKKIVIIKSENLFNYLKKKYKRINIIEVNNIKSGFQKVIDKQAFGFIDSISNIDYLIQKEYSGLIKISGKLEKMEELSIRINKENKILYEIMNKTIKNITKNEHFAISNNYKSLFLNEEDNNEELINFILLTFLIILLLSLYFRYKHHTLHQTLKEFDELLNSAIEGMVLSKDGKIIKVNNSALKIFNFNNEIEFLGKEIFDFIHNDYKDIVTENFNKEISDSYEIKMIRSNNKSFYALVRGYDMVSKGIRVSSIIDLSKLKEQEKIMLQQSKMASMGEMIRNIAHQWRQPLSTILRAATGMIFKKHRKINNSEEELKSLDNIKNNVQYLSDTIDDFRNFIKGKKDLTEIKTENLINNTLHLLEANIISNNVKIIKNIEDITIFENKNLIIQCYMNLINNSIDAYNLNNINKNKTIFLDIYSEDNNIILKIKDNRGGIEEDIILKIFEPYFTTKHKSQGTGLGLYMVYKIIMEGFKGSIEVKKVEYSYENKNEIGTEFIISIPKSNKYI